MSEYLVVTGMSGAGRSTAAACLEDLGWFVIDNIPAALMTRVATLVDRPGPGGLEDVGRLAFVVGRGGEESLADLGPALSELRRRAGRMRVLFLDSSDEILVRRYEGSRRRHPLSASGVGDAVARERLLLAPIRSDADIVVDTAGLNVNQLRLRIGELFAVDEDVTMQMTVLSFGFKHGIPLDVDLVFDCRFLANPYWIEELRPLSGLDPAVRDYVMGSDRTEDFLGRVRDLLDLILPAYEKEGKSYLGIALGCTGGRHRSVVLAEELSRRLGEAGFGNKVFHRDLDR
ncbi:MAG: RNase adapter RapZ [Actinomycetota bacterium]|nr:RNase adapter RapZ [Actinomycetota bacterium]